MVIRVFRGLETRRLRHLGDPKKRLQERVQGEGVGLPHYETTAERGPDHAREFEVRVSALGRVLGSGVGRSRRDAEQAAAEDALRHLEEQV
jgi:ribonuclease-3